jgi:hypothetical protein
LLIISFVIDYFCYRFIQFLGFFSIFFHLNFDFFWFYFDLLIFYFLFFFHYPWNWIRFYYRLMPEYFTIPLEGETKVSCLCYGKSCARNDEHIRQRGGSKQGMPILESSARGRSLSICSRSRSVCITRPVRTVASNFCSSIDTTSISLADYCSEKTLCAWPFGKEKLGGRGGVSIAFATRPAGEPIELI